MPYIEVKLFDHRLEDGVAAHLVAGITDALCDACGEEVRDRTEVVIQGISPSMWGFAGQLANDNDNEKEEGT